MKLKKLSGRIYMLPFVERTDRPNLYYIKGDDYSVAIDAGNSASHVHEFYRQLGENGLELPRYTILTHWHWDHSFGLHAVEGASIASELTNQKLSQVMEWQWTREKMAEREQAGEDIAFCNRCILEEYENLDEIKVACAGDTVEDFRELDLGGIHLLLSARDSTHSRDSLFIYIKEEKALVVGDADCEDYYDNNGQYHLGKLRELIEFLESVDYERHLLSHGYEESKGEALKRLKDVWAEMAQLETDRLILRPWREEEAEILYQYAKDPQVGPRAGWPPHTSVEDSRNVIETILSAPGVYAIVLKETKEPIGCISLIFGAGSKLAQSQDEAEIGYWLGVPYWGQGYMTEAARGIIGHGFGKMGLRAIWGGYFEGNGKSRRIQEKCGLVYDHTKEKVPVKLLGEVRTEHVMKLTKESWLQRQKEKAGELGYGDAQTLP